MPALDVVGLGAHPQATPLRAVKAEPEPPAVPVQRLVITRLVLNNFKSYAGVQEIGPFHSSFSAVVGPNGSGKSNVIDSLLFVFGFRANKMRQGKLSALIHNSAAHPDLPFCSVEVYFEDVLDNPDGSTVPVPDSGLVICRKAFRNSTSRYTINGRESSFTEVTTLLRDRGIDLDHKRFLILQGEVESIAQMKPKAQGDNDDGLLEYLEDIIGTARYKSMIEETEVELRAQNDVCAEKQSRLALVEKEKDALEASKNTVIEYLQDQNSLTLKKSALYQVYLSDCRQNIELSQQLVGELQAKLAAEQEQHQGSAADLGGLEQRHAAAQQALEAIRSTAKTSAKALAKYERDVVHLTEKQKHVQAKQEKLAKTIAGARLATGSSSSWTTDYEEEIAKLRRELDELKQSLVAENAQLDAIKESLEEKTSVFSDQIEQKKKLLVPWNEKINSALSAQAVAKKELQILVDKKAADQAALDEQEERVQEVKRTGRAKEQERVELEQQIKHVARQIALGEDECAAAETELEQTRSALYGVRQRADDARQAYAASQNQGNVVTSLMRLNDSGRIAGFHGRLGNLGAIDERYDVAISTACPALNNMVTDTVETGQACIDYLRKNNLGRAIFILLEKLPKRDLGPIATPENVPRLFDLVRPKDPRFAPAFYSVLQDTLVAADMAQANRIAYGKKRWRVVTLDGKLIDKSGTMSGGGTRVARGLMRASLTSEVSEAALAQVEAEAAEAEGHFKELQQRFNQMEDALHGLQKDKPELELKLSKCELEIQALGTHYVDAQQQLKDKKAQLRASSDTDAETQSIEAKLCQIELEIEGLRDKTAGIEREIEDLEEQIMEVGGVKMRLQKAKVDSILQQIEIRTDRISNSELSRAKSLKEATKQNKIIETSTRELAAVDGELEQVAAELGKARLKAQDVERTSTDSAFAVEEKEEELAALKAELDAYKKELNGLRAAELETRNSLDGHQKNLKESKAKLRHWTDKLRELAMQDVGDGQPTELAELSADELAGLDKNALKSEIALLEDKFDNTHIDLSVLDDYRRRQAEYDERSVSLRDAVDQRDTAKARYDDLRKKRLDQFMAGFSQISIKLKEMYQMITMGGNAELELVDSLDPFSEGILFSVMPPKKSWKNISNLSGGEKTLSSLALVFALHHYKPTPLYVMDEIDAALDFRNVSIVANYIKERTKNAQFIVISLRNNMFELAQQLVGIYKVNSMTKSITIQNREYM
ncbi:RecF/RecN/SMC [Dipodascopsis tothii]|uniref:RecF/RecN/SMC n=1 Tax=Dipodascopsis tothii TaxID=44089 RepID=UPI0034CFE790